MIQFPFHLSEPLVIFRLSVRTTSLSVRYDIETNNVTKLLNVYQPHLFAFHCQTPIYPFYFTEGHHLVVIHISPHHQPWIGIVIPAFLISAAF